MSNVNSNSSGNVFLWFCPPVTSFPSQVVLRPGGDWPDEGAHSGQQCVPPPCLSGGAAHQRVDGAVDAIPFRAPQASGTGCAAAGVVLSPDHAPGALGALAHRRLRQGRLGEAGRDESQSHFDLW